MFSLPAAVIYIYVTCPYMIIQDFLHHALNLLLTGMCERKKTRTILCFGIYSLLKIVTQNKSLSGGRAYNMCLCEA